MVDIAFGPGRDPRPASGTTAAYLAMVRRRRMYGGILLVLFVVLMASGFDLAQGRNAGGFLQGLPRVLEFPAEVQAEAWE